MSDSAIREALSGVEFIALDAVGTLIRAAQPVAATYVEVAAKHGVMLSQAEVAKRFTTAISRHSVELDFDSPDHATSEAFERTWWRGFIAEVLQIDSHHAQAIFDDLWHVFAQPESWRLYDDAIPLIEFLETSNIPWVIASNFDARLHSICRANPHLSQAKAVYVSSEVLWRKPSIHFYRQIEAKLRCNPASLLMIGDDPITDIAAAKFASWRALRIVRGGAPMPGELANLADIPRHLLQI